MEVFDKDCLIRLGTCIAPRGMPEDTDEELMRVEMSMPDGSTRMEGLKLGDIVRVHLDVGEVAKVKITPHKECDVGVGPGQNLEATVEGGVAGVLLDARGRPVRTLKDRVEMKKVLLKWFRAIDMYPKEALDSFEKEIR